MNQPHRTYTCSFEALSEKMICGFIPKIEDRQVLNELKRKKITFTDSFGRETEINLLIGADVLGKLLTGNSIELKSGLTAVETKLVFGQYLERVHVLRINNHADLVHSPGAGITFNCGTVEVDINCPNVIRHTVPSPEEDRRLKFKGGSSCREFSRNNRQLSKSNDPPARTFREIKSTCADLCKRFTVDDNEKCSHRTDFPALYDELEAKIRALERLGWKQDKYGEFFSLLVESCLPEDILLAFERSKKFKEDTPGEGRTLKL
ncbi:DUF1758 domain-containing protein [Trichonephila clavipes]|nr:DUF1758 domain-containing protein [Trichonephila clavipes]